ncbi:hypothetical protein C900_05129 [Fulvivirga imtechensis AK7]|uniref:Uncharacterized protein n=1 Tax=Fulvivirga imtechensis AK7 TaxID=1237149 RepID=L8JPB5_9BACT|nr:hypothetical protein C900_05129 [Fulvivirga imtechensis AK7]
MFQKIPLKLTLFIYITKYNSSVGIFLGRKRLKGILQTIEI